MGMRNNPTYDCDDGIVVDSDFEYHLIEMDDVLKKNGA